MDCALFQTPEVSSRRFIRERDRLAALLCFLRRWNEVLPLELRPSNPNLPIDWRWRLARFIATLPRRLPPQFLDSWTRRAVDYLLKANPDDGVMAEITHLAQILTGLPDKNLPRVKLQPEHSEQYLTAQELCARLLAGQSNEQIAERLSLPAAVIEGFEQLHFAVRECLDMPSFMTFHAIETDRGGPLARLGVLWRHYAYAGRTAVLDLLLSTYHSFPADVRTLGIEAYLAKKVSCPPLVRLLVGVRLLDVTPQNAVESLQWLIQAFGRLREQESIAACPKEPAENPAVNLAEVSAMNPAAKSASNPMAKEPTATIGPVTKVA